MDEALSHSQRAVQSCHAVIEACQALGVSGQPSLVLLAVNDFSECLTHLNEIGIRHVSFREPDMQDKITAVATEAIGGKDRKHFRKYKLLQ